MKASCRWLAATSAVAAAVTFATVSRANNVCYTNSCGSCSPGGGHRSTLIPASAFPSEPDGVTTMAFVDPNDGTPRRFVATQQGRIFVWNGSQILPTPFLDITSRVLYDAVHPGEQGLLAMAVAPDYEVSGRFFLYSIGEGSAPGNDGDIVVERYQRSAANPNLADPTPTTVLTIPHPGQTNHNGGWLAFGPNDGDLYISTGDGGGGCDSSGPHGQSLTTLLGKVLRIDVNSTSGGDCATSTNYGIPAGNPLVGQTGCDEIWAYGLRNPFRFSFDRGDAVGSGKGDLWIGDVGQSNFEEINYQAASRAAPLDFGWVRREGCRGSNTGTSMCGGGETTNVESCQYPYTADPDPSVGDLYDPVLCHSAGSGWHSVMSGYRYRGAQVAALGGRYVYSDNFCGQIWASTAISGSPTGTTASCWSQGSPGVYAFAEDHLGELYVVTGYGATVDCIDAGSGCPWAGYPMFAQGFESGDLSRWSAETP